MKKFLEFNKSTGKYELNDSKAYIAKYFGITTQTLRTWLRKNGYDYLIGKMKGKLGSTQTKQEEKEEKKDSPKRTPKFGDKNYEPPKADEWEELPDGHPDKVDLDFLEE